jgi:3-isopropylmalate/(R)-2-methylmalate dehydratase small subunit
VRAGFRAVVAGSFAEIFFANATTLGLVCLALAGDDLAASPPPSRTTRGPRSASTSRRLLGRGRRAAATRASCRRPRATSSSSGRYDPLAELLANDAAIAATAAALPYVARAGA